MFSARMDIPVTLAEIIFQELKVPPVRGLHENHDD
jgi:hypothetical protein